ncbi:hypothetical protein [Haloarchaeobius sp. TZWSO28]|uniref:hypothetical protein n=1 Tax=Haloarchaeobius sp. TZWSO28 TaxID=3446119 RepID=UPI003EBA57E3
MTSSSSDATRVTRDWLLDTVVLVLSVGLFVYGVGILFDVLTYRLPAFVYFGYAIMLVGYAYVLHTRS